MRPRSFFLLGAALAAVVLIVELTEKSGTCSLSPAKTWQTWVAYILGPLSVGAIFASIFTWSRERGSREWTALNWFAQALVGACVWGGAGWVVVFLIAVDKSGCLS